jgi:hypothetical protein
MTIARTCALVVLLTCALSAPAAAATPSLRVDLGSVRQAKLLAGESVPVTVHSNRARRVRVTALARTTGAGSGAARAIAVSRVLTFRRAGVQRTRLTLTPAGRRTLSGCDGRRLVVSAGGTSATDLVTIDRSACAERATANVDTANADRCDFLDKSVCLHPWPNDHFTREDDRTPTGRRLNLNRLSMPANVAGVPIDPTDQNRADGFSPGNLVVTHVPGLDNQEAFRRTGAVPVDDMARYADPGQPVVVINARTRKRHLIWSELDVNAAKPEDANLIIRPGVNWDEGGRYIVALRRLKDADGNPIEAQAEFRAYRDRQKTSDPAFEARRKHMESLLRTLRRAGIPRDDLYLAWDFTVASEHSLAGRMLQIRDDAFAKLGDTNLSDLTVQGAAPTFFVDTVENLTPAQDANIGRRVKGRMLVPCYLNAPGCPPGSRFLFTPLSDDTPQAIPGNTMLAEFDCRIPRRQTDGEAPPARPSLYGHGLLGTAGEVGAGNVRAMAQEHNFVFCATPWAGMSQEDVPNVASILADLSNFNSLADRAQQGMVNFMYLGRLMVHPQGFDANPAFQVGTVPHGAIDTTRLFYDGNSQGGIMGGSLTAVAPDFDHAVLGVPAMNYSTLLRRSVDFDSYAVVMYRAYPNERERPLVLSLIQLLWDRGEANGYAQHMTSDPLPNSPPHKVLMHVAFGDHQVANVAADVEARTIGAQAHDPVLDPGRSFERQPLYGIARFATFPFPGSAIVYFDTGPIRPGADDGTATPPTSETPPRPPQYGADPHGKPRSTVHGRLQKSEFLRVGGQVVDVCGGRPCYAGSWTGP